MNQQETQREPTLTEVLDVYKTLPHVSASLVKLERRMFEVQDMLARAKPIEDGWLGSKEAAKYMGVSISTFEKYRYNNSPMLKGYKLGGKMLFKKADLDSFIRLYEVNSALGSH